MVGLVLFLLEWSRDAAAASDPSAPSGAAAASRSSRSPDAQLEDATLELANRLGRVLDAIKQFFVGGDVELTISTSMRQTLDDYEARRARLPALRPPLCHRRPPSRTRPPTAPPRAVCRNCVGGSRCSS